MLLTERLYVRFPEDDEGLDLAENVLINALGVPRVCQQYLKVESGDTRFLTKDARLQKSSKVKFYFYFVFHLMCFASWELCSC